MGPEDTEAEGWQPDRGNPEVPESTFIDLLFNSSKSAEADRAGGIAPSFYSFDKYFLLMYHGQGLAFKELTVSRGNQQPELGLNVTYITGGH